MCVLESQKAMPLASPNKTLSIYVIIQLSSSPLDVTRELNEKFAVYEWLETSFGIR